MLSFVLRQKLYSTKWYETESISLNYTLPVKNASEIEDLIENLISLFFILQDLNGFQAI